MASDLDFSKVVYVSNDFSSYKSFKKEFKSKVKFMWAQLKNINVNLLSRSSLVIFHVSGPKTSRVLEKMNKKIKAKTIVLNSSYPASVEEESFLEVLQVSMKHPELGSALGTVLNKHLEEEEQLRAPSGEIVSKSP